MREPHEYYSHDALEDHRYYTPSKLEHSVIVWIPFFIYFLIPMPKKESWSIFVTLETPSRSWSLTVTHRIGLRQQCFIYNRMHPHLPSSRNFTMNSHTWSCTHQCILIITLFISVFYISMKRITHIWQRIRHHRRKATGNYL